MGPVPANVLSLLEHKIPLNASLYFALASSLKIGKIESHGTLSLFFGSFYVKRI